MIDRAWLKGELDNMPEDALAQIATFIQFQKFSKGLFQDDTQYLSSIPGMVESIVEGKNTPLSDCFDTLDS